MSLIIDGLYFCCIQTGGNVSVVHMKMLLALFEVAGAVELLMSINSI